MVSDSSDDSNSPNSGSDTNSIHVPRKSDKIVQQCPFCKSSNIYKRTRIIEKRSDAKPYRCNKCKEEFSKPIIGKKTITHMEKIYGGKKR